MRPPRFLAMVLAGVSLLGIVTAPAVAQLPPEPATVQVGMKEFTFRPAVIVLTAGHPARLVLVNQGQIAHQFETGYLRAIPVRVTGGPLSAETAGVGAARVDPDGSARLDFVPRSRGRFVFACTLEGHQEAGMHGVLEVR